MAPYSAVPTWDPTGSIHILIKATTALLPFPNPVKTQRSCAIPSISQGCASSCQQAWNQTEQTERRVRSGSARWLACSVRLARWHDPIARARLGSAEQPIGLLGLGLRHQAEPLG